MKRGILFAIIFLFLIGIASSANYCCEKTKGSNPAWCQNVDSESKCDSNYRSIPAFCQATSYCKGGTCVNQKEGICMPNTPEVVCANQETPGFWSEKLKTELPQCQLGCCLLGNQAAFVTQINCNRMAALYGVNITWQPNLNTELSCLASANPSVKGACVYTKDYSKTCSFVTKKECQDMSKSSAFSGVEFREGFLCSASELETDCGPSDRTTCDEKEDVRFVDTCGNLANIYDSNYAFSSTGKPEDYQDYWTKIQAPKCNIAGNIGNKNSAKCGDCDYLLGSMCKQKKTGDSVKFGNYLCKSLDCVDYKGDYTGTGTPKHGETWCETDNTDEASFTSPGASFFRMVCYNGEVTIEQCDATRQKICAEAVIDEATGFRTANCKANLWTSCSAQNNSEDCLDDDLRDCEWKEWSGYYFSSKGLINISDSLAPKGLCLPKYPSGFERDGTNKVLGGESCVFASSVCYVRMRKALVGDWYCDTNDPASNCSCLDKYDGSNGEYVWKEGLNNVCVQLGDCGEKVNYIGEQGKQYSDVVKMINVSVNASA